MKYINVLFYSIFLTLTVGCCLVPVGSLVLLIKDYLTYHTLGNNLQDLFCITAVGGLNAILFSVLASLVKSKI